METVGIVSAIGALAAGPIAIVLLGRRSKKTQRGTTAPNTTQPQAPAAGGQPTNPTPPATTRLKEQAAKALKQKTLLQVAISAVLGFAISFAALTAFEIVYPETYQAWLYFAKSWWITAFLGASLGAASAGLKEGARTATTIMICLMIGVFTLWPLGEGVYSNVRHQAREVAAREPPRPQERQITASPGLRFIVEPREKVTVWYPRAECYSLQFPSAESIQQIDLRKVVGGVILHHKGEGEAVGLSMVMTGPTPPNGCP